MSLPSPMTSIVGNRCVVVRQLRTGACLPDVTAAHFLLAGMPRHITVTLPDLLRRTIAWPTLETFGMFAVRGLDTGMLLHFPVTLPDLLRRAILRVPTKLFRFPTLIFFRAHHVFSCLCVFLLSYCADSYTLDRASMVKLQNTKDADCFPKSPLENSESLRSNGVKDNSNRKSRRLRKDRKGNNCNRRLRR